MVGEFVDYIYISRFATTGRQIVYLKVDLRNWKRINRRLGRIKHRKRSTANRRITVTRYHRRESVLLEALAREILRFSHHYRKSSVPVELYLIVRIWRTEESTQIVRNIEGLSAWRCFKDLIEAFCRLKPFLSRFDLFFQSYWRVENEKKNRESWLWIFVLLLYLFVSVFNSGVW